MAKIIVADTGPLIALAIVDLLNVLPDLFDEVHVPEAVVSEGLIDKTQPGAQQIARAIDLGYLRISTVEIPEDFEDLIDYLDRGETEALALARSLGAIAMIDEKRARRFAITHQIRVTGSAAILLKAKQEGFVPAVKPLLMTLKSHGYRLSDNLINEVLKLAKEV